MPYGTAPDDWCPDWYTFIQAAKYLNVPPWELAQQSVWWRDRAVMAMNAEAQAQHVISQRNKPA